MLETRILEEIHVESTSSQQGAKPLQTARKTHELEGLWGPIYGANMRTSICAEWRHFKQSLNTTVSIQARNAQTRAGRTALSTLAILVTSLLILITTLRKQQGPRYSSGGFMARPQFCLFRKQIYHLNHSRSKHSTLGITKNLHSSSISNLTASSPKTSFLYAMTTVSLATLRQVLTGKWFRLRSAAAIDLETYLKM